MDSPPNWGNREAGPPPPINASSSLMAVQPLQQQLDVSMTQPASFDIQNLQIALVRSQQASAPTGLRRATSAPHSMDSLGQPEQEYMPPSGGPMRRVASSLGMRRSSSFFWTPAAHHDFEHAIGTLNARGSEISPAAIMQLMGHHSELKMTDIDRHLKKKQLVQRRVLQQLNTTPQLAPAAAGGLDFSTGASQPNSPSMTSVAEEPSGFTGGGATPASAVPPLALIDQLDRQKQQHRQMAVIREQMLASADGQTQAIAATGT